MISGAAASGLSSVQQEKKLKGWHWAQTGAFRKLLPGADERLMPTATKKKTRERLKLWLFLYANFNM